MKKYYLTLIMITSSLSLYGMQPAEKDQLFAKIERIAKTELPTQQELSEAKEGLTRLNAPNANLTEQEKNERTYLVRMIRFKIARASH